jgi:DNA-binding MarR family transcriptional regulator
VTDGGVAYGAGRHCEGHEVSAHADAVDELRAAVALLMGAERRLKGRLSKSGTASLAHSHLRALFLLLHEGEATAGALARATDLNPASVTAMIDQLQQRGLLERRRHAQDRRVCLVALTAAGRSEVAAQERQWVGRLHEVFADVGPDDLLTASRVIERLTTVMERTRCEGDDG